MFSFLERKRAASTIILIIGFTSPVLSQKTFLSLAALNDSADHYLPRLLEKKALVSSASSYITETRNAVPAIHPVQRPGKYCIGQFSCRKLLFLWDYSSSSAGVRAANDYQAASGNIAVLAGEYDLVDFGYKNARIPCPISEELVAVRSSEGNVYSSWTDL